MDKLVKKVACKQPAFLPVKSIFICGIIPSMPQQFLRDIKKETAFRQSHKIKAQTI